MVTSPPNRGGQAIPQPDPLALVEEDTSLFFTGSDFTIFNLTKPVLPEIKVSTLKNSFFCLPDSKVFNDRCLPDPSPSFLEQIVPHSRFDSNYFLSLHRLVTAPGPNYSANTYNFQGARIPLAHSQLNIPKWKELFANYPRADIIEKLEFGFPIGVDKDSDLVPATKNHSSSYMFYSWVDKFCVKEISKCGLTGHHQTSPLGISDFHRTVKTTYFSRTAFSLLSLG